MRLIPFLLTIMMIGGAFIGVLLVNWEGSIEHNYTSDQGSNDIFAETLGPDLERRANGTPLCSRADFGDRCPEQTELLDLVKENE